MRGARPDAAPPLAQIPGRPPLPTETVTGCPFRPRCAQARDLCAERPLLAPRLAGQVAWMHQHGVRALFGLRSGQDAVRSDQVILNVGQGGIGLPERDYYFKTDSASVALRAAYVDHIARSFVMTGVSDALAKGYGNRILALETALAKVSMTMVQRRDPHAVYHKMPIDSLKAMASGFDWNTYLGTRGLAKIDSVNISSLDFFRGFPALLAGNAVVVKPSEVTPLIALEGLERACFLAALPFLDSWLRRADRRSARLRVSIALAAAAIVPVLVSLPLLLVLMDSGATAGTVPTIRMVATALVLATGLAAGSVGWWFAGRMTRSLRGIEAALAKIAAGEAGVAIPVSSTSELRSLGLNIAAMVQAMQERTVTIDGIDHKLSDRFMVVATQNPIESQGVYPLPEAQLDRFLLRLSVGYPSQDAALAMLLEVPLDDSRYRRACSEVVALAKSTGRLDFEVDRFLTTCTAGGPTEFPQAVRSLAERWPKRGLVVVVSDLMKPDGFPESFRTLGALGHELRVVHLSCEEDRKPSLEGELELFDAEYTMELMRRSDGNLSEAARQAGMDRSNFRRLIKKPRATASPSVSMRRMYSEIGVAFWT